MRIFYALTAAFLLLSPGAPARAQDTEAFFNQYCAACHTIGGGRLIGPDLKNVTDRQDRFWLQMFVLDPEDVVGLGDPYAKRIVEEAGGIVMPHISEVTPQIAEALLDFIEAKSRADGAAAPDDETAYRSLTPEEVERGRRFFLGAATLSSGAAPCFSCHTTQGAGAPGGGRFGPDLSQVFERLEGRKALGAWLAAPPTPTMRASYVSGALTPAEVSALVAFLEAEAAAGGSATWRSVLQLLLFGASGMAIALVAVGCVWRRRFRAVRRPLVDESREGGTA